MKKEYSVPKLYDANGDINRQWFVYFYHNGQRKKIYKGINKYGTPQGRRRAAKKVISDIILRQKLDFKNSFQKKIEDYLLKRKYSWRDSTFKDHSSKISIFFEWLGFEEFNNNNIRLFFAYLLQTRSRTTHNNYKTVLKQLFTEALLLSKEESDTLFHGVNFVKQESKAPTPFSLSLIQRLKNEMVYDYPTLWMFCQLQYYCFIRPGEIRQLRIRDIMIDDKKIIIDSNISKNRKTRYCVIPEVFLESLEKYIKYRLLNEYVCPSTRGKCMIAGKNYYRSLHQSIVTKIGLSTKRYKLYSWKPTGMLHAIKNGASIKFLKEQAGHYSIDQTDSYLRAIGWMDEDNSSSLFPKI